MKTGLFCFYPSDAPDGAGALAAQTELVELAEGLGFDEAWVAEHHFDPHAVSPAITVLLGYLAGRTRRIRLGSAAVLLPLRNPVLVAEDIATIDVLCGGRFNLGVAKGGLFPGQHEHFGIRRLEAREQTLEALRLVSRLLREREVSFETAQHRVEKLTLLPRPVQNPIPTWLASMTEGAVRAAAQAGYGLMGTLLAPAAKLGEVARLYEEAAPGGNPRYRVARFFHMAATSRQAREEARPAIAAFANRMHANAALLAPGEPNHFSEENMMARSLVGCAEEVIEQIAALRAAAPIEGIMLKPAVLNGARAATALKDFAAKVMPMLVADQ